MSKSSKHGFVRTRSSGSGRSGQIRFRLPALAIAPPLSPAATTRLKAVEFARSHGVLLAATAFQVNRATIYRWLARYHPARLETLEQRSRAPKQRRAVCWTWSDEQLIITARTAHPSWGKRKLHWLLLLQGCLLSESTIGRILSRLLASGRIRQPRLIPMRRRRPTRPHATRIPAGWQPTQPGDLIQIDTVHVRPLPTLERRQFSAIDVVSRVAVFGVRAQATAGTAAAFLTDLIDRMPVPIKAIQVDGGSEFMAEFESACQEIGIAVYVLPPRSPKLNGRVERLNRTSREEFWQCYDGDLDLPTLTTALRHFEVQYNAHRPHQALAMRTPTSELARLLAS